MAQPSVASAVVLPDASPSPPPPARSPSPPEARAGTKRRQSSASRASPKRQRLSPSPDQSTKEDPNRHHAPATRPPRPSKPVDEKKRSQRLFGALLGGLGQTRPANSAAAKRRAEQEERRRQKEQELSERQKERVERLDVARKKEQRRVDEASMRIKHDSMRAMANFLTTSAEPKLYFKPWELLPEQEEQIKHQRDDVDAQIDQELDDFDQVRQRWQREDDNGHTDHQDGTPTNRVQDTADGTNDAPEPASESAPVSEQALESTEPTAVTAPEICEVQEPQEQIAEEAERQRKDSIDDTGDIVVEADEDTVIY